MTRSHRIANIKYTRRYRFI